MTTASRIEPAKTSNSGHSPVGVVRALDPSEVSPHDKALVALGRMMRERLGDERRLHPAAERYQRAAYQRQAARRLAAMLADFGGAMLCDGVGLGKTYVGTTVLLHEALSAPDILATHDLRPFKATILAPSSIVSTWVRDALPPLFSLGLPHDSVRVLAHAAFSRLTSSSALLAPRSGSRSDLEHFLESDLVIVDEAHNFRASSAKRTKVLRDLLRLQPRREQNRRVLLLTATPINNGLDDLRQELSLLFSRPTHLSFDPSPNGYLEASSRELGERVRAARSEPPRTDVAALIAHGHLDRSFSDAIDWRTHLILDPSIHNLGDYLRDEERRLQAARERLATVPAKTDDGRQRVAEALLDRIVVQRSRDLCRRIEAQHGDASGILFRPDPGPPRRIPYDDAFGGVEAVLEHLLRLFSSASTPVTAHPDSTQSTPLGFHIYLWHDLAEGRKTIDETSSVVGLQRVLALKRLESSPVAFLITLLRLVARHATRLSELVALADRASDFVSRDRIRAEIESTLARHEPAQIARIARLLGRPPTSSTEPPESGLLSLLSADVISDESDVPNLELDLFEDRPSPDAVRFARLLPLSAPLISDFDTLLGAIPTLANAVFNGFDPAEEPAGLAGARDRVTWPTTFIWATRLVTDAKLAALAKCLLAALSEGDKVLVFSQFGDTIAYLRSVLSAVAAQPAAARHEIALHLGHQLDALDLLVARTACVSGDTDADDKEGLIDRFAPFYRVGPFPPALASPTDHSQIELSPLLTWEASWTEAIRRPIDVLFGSDVLAEGVNLQDVAVLVNYDLHWNPVRMIQRAGRIDRRLNPRIETATEFPALNELAKRLGLPAPRYGFLGRSDRAPETVNLILPDTLEAELRLREKLALKTLTIDLTLGLERGTGAEADWMDAYTYQGVRSLSAFQRDRGIEILATRLEALVSDLESRGLSLQTPGLDGWLREVQTGRDVTTPSELPILARARLGRRGGDVQVYQRYLEPALPDGVMCWLWSLNRPEPSTLDVWLILDSKTFPPLLRGDLPRTRSASLPVSVDHLLAAIARMDRVQIEELPPRVSARPIQQGVTAISAGCFGNEADRKSIVVREISILQLELGPLGSGPLGLEST